MSAVIFYTLEEIKKNTGKDGNRLWIIYKDSVYDVTDYVENVSLNFCYYDTEFYFLRPEQYLAEQERNAVCTPLSRFSYCYRYS